MFLSGFLHRHDSGFSTQACLTGRRRVASGRCRHKSTLALLHNNQMSSVLQFLVLNKNTVLTVLVLLEVFFSPGPRGPLPAPSHSTQMNGSYQAPAELDDNPFIWIRCVGAGKHLNQAGGGPRGPGFCFCLWVFVTWRPACLSASLVVKNDSQQERALPVFFFLTVLQCFLHRSEL